jgi:hypothetical protein
MNAVENHLKESISKEYSDRVIHGRVANLTEQKGRGPCMYRNLCSRGCFSGYFSSNSSTLLDAQETGNLTLKSNSIVKNVIYDENLKKSNWSCRNDALSKQNQLLC